MKIICIKAPKFLSFLIKMIMRKKIMMPDDIISNT